MNWLIGTVVYIICVIVILAFMHGASIKEKEWNDYKENSQGSRSDL